MVGLNLLTMSSVFALPKKNKVKYLVTTICMQACKSNANFSTVLLIPLWNILSIICKGQFKASKSPLQPSSAKQIVYPKFTLKIQYPPPYEKEV